MDEDDRFKLKIQLVRIEGRFKLMLALVGLFMAGFSFSRFMINYYVYFVETCEKNVDDCPYINYFEYTLIGSMLAVFIIDNICSVLLIIAVKRIYHTIKRYFNH